MRKIIAFILIAAGLTSIVHAQTDKELFDKGADLLNGNRLHEAVEVFTTLINQAPENPGAYKKRGLAFMGLKQYDEAIKDFEKIREINPDLKGLYSDLGVAWYYKGEYDKAIENYNREIHHAPDNHLAYFNRAICLSEIKDYDKSLEDIHRALELSPNFYMGLCLKGDVLSKKGRIKEASESYEKAIALDREHLYAKKQLAALPLTAVEKKQAKETEPPISKTAYASPSEGFEVQTGAFKVRQNAKKMSKRLGDSGYEARVLELESDDGTTWYLVRIGPSGELAGAEKLKKQLKQKLGMDSIIRPGGLL